jgi:hypothetical protein
MAKNLLKDFRISGDIIDQVAGEETVATEVQSVDVSSPNSGATGPESRPGADGAEPKEAELASAAANVETASSAEAKFVKDGMFHTFVLGELTYRVGGVKPVFVTSLRVNLRTTGTGLNYYDSLDLYSAKARSVYAAAVNRQGGPEAARVEKDLVVILEALEAERDQALRASGKKLEVVMSEADRQAGMALLKDPRVFERIDADLTALGYVGEELNKFLLYLCASSRKLDDPISVMILSQSASGKSFLVECVRKLMPPEDVVAVTSLSDQALNYIDDLTHKFLVLGEAVHGDVVEHQIREMLSGKELSRLVTVKDVESGKMKSTVVRTPVIVASVLSGTNHRVNPENASRYFVANTDESRTQTARIHEHQRRKYSLERLASGKERAAEIVKTHQAAQRLLVKRNIVNDFATLLDFPTALMRLRRDHDRFLDLIAAVCFLRQYQKPVQEKDGLAFIACDLTDYEIAYRIMVEGVMSSTVRELPKGAVVVYEEVRDWVHEEAKRQRLNMQEINFTQRQVREATGLGHTWVKGNLRLLVDYEYVVQVGGAGARSKAVYRLRADEDVVKADLSMIPTPAVMRTLTGGKS